MASAIGCSVTGVLFLGIVVIRYSFPSGKYTPYLYYSKDLGINFFWEKEESTLKKQRMIKIYI
ncbi:MAG: hypothetical protein IJT90_01625 [Bacteroidaceae bacterium]|nr:hypothetical protein [Bacteroidaceae bacterium]